MVSAVAWRSSNQSPVWSFVGSWSSMPPRNATFITTRRDFTPVTACTRQLVPGGSGIVALDPVRRRVAGLEQMDLLPARRAERNDAGAGAVRLLDGAQVLPRARADAAPVCASSSVSIASAATVEFASRSVLSSKLTCSCPPAIDRRSAARSAELMSAV